MHSRSYMIMFGEQLIDTAYATLGGTDTMKPSSLALCEMMFM